MTNLTRQISIHPNSPAKLTKPSILLHRSNTAPSLRRTSRSWLINPRNQTSWRPSVHELPPMPAEPAAASLHVTRPSLRPSLPSSSSRKRSSLFSIGEEDSETHPISSQPRIGEGDRLEAENKCTHSQAPTETHIRPGVPQSPEPEPESFESVLPRQESDPRTTSEFPVQTKSWSTDLAAAASLAEAYASAYASPLSPQDLHRHSSNQSKLTNHNTPPAVTPRPVVNMRPISWDAPRSIVETGDEGWDGSEYSPINGRSRQGS